MTKPNIKDSSTDTAPLKKDIILSLDEAAAVAFLEKQRWGDRPVCPHCGSNDVYRKKNTAGAKSQASFHWCCRECNKRYTVRTASLFDRSRIPLRHWCFAWHAFASGSGVSVEDLHRKTGVSEKSCRSMIRRIRSAMTADAGEHDSRLSDDCWSPPVKGEDVPETILVDSEEVLLQQFLKKYRKLQQQAEALKQVDNKAVRRYRREEELKPYQAELIQMQKYLEENNQRMIILFEGRDAAGKAGTTRRVTRYMNEKHYRVVALGKPTELQRSQWYFQRYIQQLPRGGEVVLLDGSWYHRATVERVFGFCSDQEYVDFMRGVSGFEKDLVRQGISLVKLYFSVSKEEQARRFDQRKTDPLHQWKLNEIDAQAQDRWEDFSRQKYEMLKYTHTLQAPWAVIRYDNKHQARLNAMRVILNSVQYPCLDPELDFDPDSKVVVSGARELELMEAKRNGAGQFLG